MIFFTNGDALKWVITNLTDQSPLNLTGVYTGFTTKDSLSLGNPGSIVLKVRDDGYHYLDVTCPMQNVQVASYNLWIIDPTGIKLVSQTPTPDYINWATDPVETETEIVWQFTYDNQDFPWAGSSVTEYINGDAIQYERNVDSPTSYVPTGDDEPEYEFTEIENTGCFYDYHDAQFYKPLPISGKYHVAYCSQRFQNDMGY
jgi:hypothetical protein